MHSKTTIISNKNFKFIINGVCVGDGIFSV